MTGEDYRNAVISAAQISMELTSTLDENEQVLFEEYGNVYEKIVQYESANKILNS